MKRKFFGFLAVLLVLSLCFALFVGCGENTDGNNGGSTDGNGTEAANETKNYPTLSFIPANDGTTYTVKASSVSDTTGEIVVPETVNGKPVTSIARNGFANCTITKITLPSGLEKINQGAFKSCVALTEIVIPDKVTTIPSNAFSNCAELTSVTLGKAVTSVGDSAFYECAKLASVKFDDALTLIDDNAFKGCVALEALKFPTALASIGAEAFSGCTSLTVVKIPASVTSIGDFCFGFNNGSQYPGKLAAVYFYGNVPSGVNQSFGYTWDADEFVAYVPAEYYGAYENADAADWKRCIVTPKKLKSFDPAEKPYDED